MNGLCSVCTAVYRVHDCLYSPVRVHGRKRLVHGLYMAKAKLMPSLSHEDNVSYYVAEAQTVEARPKPRPMMRPMPRPRL